MMCVQQVNTAMAPQLLHLSVQGDISAQVAQNLPHNTLADRALTTMSPAKHLNLLANCVIQGSTVKALGEFGQMDCAMKDFTALVGHGPSALEILVWRIMIMQQALLIVVIHPLNVSAQLGTRLQVIFVQQVTIVLKVLIVLYRVNLVSSVHMRQWLHHKAIVQRDITAMTVLQCLTSSTVQWDITVQLELESQFLALQGNSQIPQGTPTLGIVETVPPPATALVQEIQLPQTYVLQSITVQVVKAQQHQTSICVRQVISAKGEHHDQ